MNKSTISLLLFFLISLEIFSQSSMQNTVYRNGIGLGTVIAVAISWSRNKSVRFAILHGILSWFYVIFYVFRLKDK